MLSGNSDLRSIRQSVEQTASKAPGMIAKAGKGYSDFIFGTYAGELGDVTAKLFCEETGIAYKAPASGFWAGVKQFGKDITTGETWRNCGSNIKTAWNVGPATKFATPCTTVKELYKDAQMQTKEKAAKALEAKRVKADLATYSPKGFWATKFAPVSNLFKAAGKSILGVPYLGTGLKTLGGACKKLPGIGTLLLLACEIPEVYSAFTKGGIWEGVKQTGKTALGLGAFAAGTAAGTMAAGIIGQTLCPIPGLGFVLGVAGGMAAGWLMSKITGPSFSEKHEAQAEQQSATKKMFVPQNDQKSPYGSPIDFRGTSNNYRPVAMNQMSEPFMADPNYASAMQNGWLQNGLVDI